ncbi:pupal cuticle protein 20-like [Ochlerotatus camptorhynchus]|uniref:pupal cuticle protein 20-like n=1 Tax=Ochlerotatus camptorhynchus TaxID=644619 RepID=UPI0031DB42B4
MKCLIVFSLLTVGCVLAQNYNDGRYYPELYASKFDDGKWHPDKTGSYSRGDRTKGTGNPSIRFGSASGIGSGASVVGPFGDSFGSSTGGFNAATATGSFTGAKMTNTNFGDSSAKIKEDTRQLNEDGSYFYRVLNDNNIEISETGRVDNAGTDDQVMRAKGYYEYIGDDGVLYRVDYVADENGFQASGAHLPTPPPIPEAILRSLKLRGLARK